MAETAQISSAITAGISDSDTIRGGAGVSYNNGSRGLLKIDTRGERIFAICFRKINFKFYSGSIDPSLRRGYLWRLSNNRGNTTEEIELVEADLEDKSDWAGNEVSAKSEIGGSIFVCLL